MEPPTESAPKTPFPKILILTLLIVLPIFSFVLGMKYQQTKNIQTSFPTPTIQLKNTPSPTSFVSSQINDQVNQGNQTPYPSQVKTRYEINGNEIYRIEGNNSYENGRLYKEITSPDKSKNIVLVEGYLSTFQFFIREPNSKELKEIGIAEEVVWSNDSRYIAFTSKVADAGSTYRIKLYDAVEDKIIPLNDKVDKNIIANPNLTSYHNPRWLSDNSGVTVDYKEYDQIPYGEIIAEGTITIVNFR